MKQGRIHERLIAIKQNPFARDSAWSFAGTISGTLLVFISGIIIANIIEEDGYGKYGLIKTTMTTLSTFTTIGLGYTSTKFIADFLAKKPWRAKLVSELVSLTTFFLSSFVGIIVCLFSGFISTQLFKSPDMAYIVRLCGILVVVSALNLSQKGIMAGFKNFRGIAVGNILLGSTSIVLGVVCTKWWGLSGAVWSLILSQLSCCVLNRFYINRVCRTINTSTSGRAYNFKKVLLPTLIRFSFPVALKDVSTTLLAWISGILFVAWFTYSDFGLYNAAMQWNGIVFFIPTILRYVVLAYLSSTKPGSRAYNRVVKRTLWVNFLSTGSVALGLSLCAPFVMPYLYGNSFEGLPSLITVSVILSVFQGLNLVYAQVLLSQGRNWIALLLQISQDLITVLLFALFSYYSNLNGAHALMWSNIIATGLLFLTYLFAYNGIRTPRDAVE